MDKTSQVDAVNKAQKYIKANLKKKMSLHEIALYSGYSPWHISKIFKGYTGKTIFEYIRSLRLTEAAKSLRDDSPAVVDVALEFIFDTHEGFTRAFSKEFGIPPKRYSVEAPLVKYFMPYPAFDNEKLTKGEKKMSEKSTVVFAQVIDRPARKAIIKRGIAADNYFDYCEEVGCDIWGELCSVKGALYEPVGMWLPKRMRAKGTSEYVQGVEVPADYSGAVPEGYELISLDACKVMIFQGPKYEEENFQEEIGKVMDAIDEYDPAPFGFLWADEDAPRFQYAPEGNRGYIEGRPVKLIV
ncbi:MAG: helix-turn-helix transcriptional regulator [Clostridia bacterium]|nr:helix-turn-helix transcriptional regulator [Clostridia bacterium]